MVRAMLAAWVAAACLVVGPSAVTTRDARPDAGSESEHRRLVEEPGCARPAPPAAVPGPASADGLTQTVEVTVPRTVIVRLDLRGHVVEAMSNTGCRPRPGDDMWVQVVGEEELTPAAPALVREVVTLRWTGDWRRPGAWHRPAGHTT